MSNGTEINVNIRNLAFGGNGVGEVSAQFDGRSDLLGITAFVPYTTVGETVRARIVQRKDRYLHTELLDVINKAQERIEARCKLFTICGGCELQHISYDKQLLIKSEMLLGAMRSAKFPLKDLEKLEPIVPSDEYHYRRRITLHVDSSGKIGFYREASRSIVATTHCPVAVKEINDILINIQEFGKQIKGKITSVILESDEIGAVAVLKSPYDLGSAEIRSILDLSKKYFESALLVVSDREVGGFGRQILELPLNERKSLNLRVPAGYFSQVNIKINYQLVTKAVEISGIKIGQTVFDLYSGAGNFSLPFAQRGAKVTAVECDKRLVGLGKENLTRYNLEKNLNFIESSVEKFLVRVQKEKLSCDLIIADPPRSGLGTLANNFNFAKKLILISCHQPSFIRDAKILIEQGWKLKTIIPFDMFAQTSYVEILSFFER